MFKQRRENLSCPRLPKNVALGGFTTQSCSGRQRIVLKSVMHVQSSCFAHKANCFRRCCCRRRRGCLRSLIIDRGTQQRFPPKYVGNTGYPSTFRSLEMYSKRRHRIFFCSVFPGELISLFEITRVSVLFSRKFQVQFNGL